MTLTVPQDAITLMEAYNVYLATLEKAGVPTDGREEVVQDELICAIKARSIDVFVQVAGIETPQRILTEIWEREEWPERLFLSSRIASSTGLARYNDHVPFIRENRFKAWIVERLAPPEQHKNIAEPHWTFPQAMLWIACRSTVEASRYWGDATGAMIDTSQDVSVRMSDAQEKLLQALRDRRSEMIATGRPNGNAREPIRSTDWQDIKLFYDKDIRHFAWLGIADPATGNPAPVEYHNLLLERDDVMRLWPQRMHESTSEDQLRLLDRIPFGQVIEWVITKGRELSVDDLALQHDAASRDVFAALASNADRAWGREVLDINRLGLPETFPPEIWRTVNDGVSGSPEFLAMDSMPAGQSIAGRDHQMGGTLYQNSRKWTCLDVDAEFVFDNWSSAREGDGHSAKGVANLDHVPIAPQTIRRRASDQDVVRKAAMRAFDGNIPAKGTMPVDHVLQKIEEMLPEGSSHILRETMLRGIGYKASGSKFVGNKGSNGQ